MNQITHDVRRSNWLSSIKQCQNRLEGMTASNSIISLKEGRGDLLAGVFTQRFVWNDGTYYLNKEEVDERNNVIALLNSSDTFDEGIRILKEAGVSYYLEGDAGSSIALSKLDKVYSNNIMAVYKIGQ